MGTGLVQFSDMPQPSESIRKFIDEGRKLVNNGQANKAISLYEEAAKTAEKLGEKSWMGYFFQQQGVAFRVLNKVEDAKLAIKKAIGVFDPGDHVNLGGAYRDLGIVDSLLQDWVEAETHLKKSIEILSSYGKDFNSWGVSLAKLGGVYTEQKKFALARETFEQSLEIMRKQGDWFMEMTTLLGYANLDFQEKRLREMIDKLWAALGMIYEKGDYEIQKRRLVEIYGLLAKGYEATGATELAGRYREKAKKFLKEMPEEVQKNLNELIRS